MNDDWKMFGGLAGGLLAPYLLAQLKNKKPPGDVASTEDPSVTTPDDMANKKKQLGLLPGLLGGMFQGGGGMGGIGGMGGAGGMGAMGGALPGIGAQGGMNGMLNNGLAGLLPYLLSRRG